MMAGKYLLFVAISKQCANTSDSSCLKLLNQSKIRKESRQKQIS